MQRSKVLKIKGNEYMVQIPTIGQLRDIENSKVALTPYYKELVITNTIMSNWVLDLVDMSAYFSVLCPQLLKDLKAPIEQLDLFDFKELREDYQAQFVPWLNGFITAMQTKTTVDAGGEITDTAAG